MTEGATPSPALAPPDHPAGIRWLDGEAGPARLPCPNCGADIARRPVLEIPDATGRRLTLLGCEACGARFFEGLTVADYAGDPPLGAAALAFYLQQGADTWGMARRLGALGRPAGTRYLEIGCGFGFGLDIARRGLGWEVLGLDPSPFARAGREQLGLPIEPRILRPEDALEGGYDVVHASEVLEHVPDPPGLLRILRAALVPDGTLVLTTPAAEAIEPGTSPGQLVPLLSAGWHMVIQSAASLDALLRRAGFDPVAVRREGPQLVALAGPPERPGGEDPTALHRRWLEAAAAAVPAESDLGLGLRARLYRLESGAARAEAAEAAWQALDLAVRARFGQGLEGWAGIGAGAAPDLTLDALAAREPLCLGGVLLHRGWTAMQQGRSAEALLQGAAGAAARLRAALARIGSDDGDAEMVGIAARRDLVVLAAERGTTDIPARLAALEREIGAGPAAEAAARCFVALVNRGALSQARALAAVGAAAVAALRADQPVGMGQASVVYCAAMLELQDAHGRHEAATRWLRDLRGALVRAFAAGDAAPARTLFWPACEAEALGHRRLGRRDRAASVPGEALAQVAGLSGFPAAPAG